MCSLLSTWRQSFHLKDRGIPYHRRSCRLALVAQPWIQIETTVIFLWNFCWHFMLFKGTIKMMTTTCSCLWWPGWHWLWPGWDLCRRSAWGSWDVLVYWPHLSPAWRSTFLQKSAFLFSDSSRLLCVQYSLQGQNAFYSPCHFVSILLVGHSVGSLQTDGQKVESRAGFCLGRIRNKFNKNLPAMFFNN